MDNRRFTGKVAVVTGGSGVLGGMFAKALAIEGSKVAVIYHNSQEAAQSVVEEILHNGGSAKAYRCDVQSRSDVELCHEKILSELGPCDILLNGAGGNRAQANTTNDYYEPDAQEPQSKSFFDLDQRDVESVFSLNFTGVLVPTQVFARDMVGREGCCVINISSMNAYTPLTRIPAYSGAKAAVSNFTQWLAVYFSKVGIRVNAIAPGFFSTRQNATLLWNADGSPTERTKKILAATPLGRLGNPEELIGALFFLADEKAASFVTGIVIPVDGGFSSYSGV